MGEIAISPIHNVHKKYRTMNLVNPYIFAPAAATYNTYIGGVASTISTASDLATKLGISVGNISNFTVVGSDIKCKITGNYTMPDSAFENNSNITFYDDLDGLVTGVGIRAFRANDIISTTKLKRVTFKNITTLGNQSFQYRSSCDIYIPICLTFINDPLLGTNGSIIYCNSYLATNNGGGIDASIASAISAGAIVRFIANYTAPNAITTLASGTIYNTAIQLNFTPPSSTNTIDYYEVYVDGIFKRKILASGDFVTGLTASTSCNITVYARDIYYNKSLVSNTLTQSTNTTSAIPTTGLISYYKLDANSNDSYGSNNGTGTSMSYVSGKVSNAGSFNGSTSKIVIGNPTNLQISSGSISCWIKTTSPGASYRSFYGKQSAYGLFLLDGILGYYNWGTFGGSGFKSTTIDLRDGIWHHVVFVFDSGTANNKIYIDGILKLTSSMSIGSQSDAFGIGMLYSGQNINALIDESTVYSTKLTESEIQLIYNLGIGTTW